MFNRKTNIRINQLCFRANILEGTVNRQERTINMLIEKLGFIETKETTERKPAKFVAKTSVEGKAIIKKKNDFQVYKYVNLSGHTT